MSWLGNWKYRREITIDHDDVDATLSQFPVLIYLSSSSGIGSDDVTSIFDDVGANSKKIAVTKDDGTTQCYVEIERWDNDNNKAWLWVKVPAISSSEDTTLYIYYDNNKDDNTTYVGDVGSIPGQVVWGGEVEEGGKYLTSWSKSGNNPLQDIGTPEGWMCSCYSNYGDEDKIYIFLQKGVPSTTIHCWSFTRANADNPAQWTDEGVIYTASDDWDSRHVEPHGILFETQSMADARRDVEDPGGAPHSGSERKWRLYYCGVAEAGVENYGTGFITASESDLTSWTHFPGNPVYPHDASYGYPDPKACVYNNEVWLLLGIYDAGGCVDSRFSHSSNGIDNWTNVGTTLPCSYLIGTLIPFSTGILITDHAPITGNHGYSARFTTDGANIISYTGNPILSGAGGWDVENGWATIVVDKNGSPDLADAGTYYLYWWGTGDGHQLGLATSTTLTIESSVASSAFKMVYHMKDKTTATVQDSTPNANDGTKKAANEPIEYITGKIDKAQDFDGTADYITIPFGLTPAYTIEFWASPDDITGSGAIVAFERTDASYSGVAMGFYDGTDEIMIGNDAFRKGLDGISTYLTDDVWAHWVDVVNAKDDIDFYLNGTKKVLDDTTYWTHAKALAYIGCRDSGAGRNRFFNGKVDEIRISNEARSDAWIKSTYETGRDKFVTYGSEEPLSLRVPKPTVAVGNPYMF